MHTSLAWSVFPGEQGEVALTLLQWYDNESDNMNVRTSSTNVHHLGKCKN